MTATSTILPTKYAEGGIGVPASRLSAPLSRSIGIEIARFWKLLANRPAAIIPDTNTWANVTPPSRSWWPNTAPKITSSRIGKAKMKTIASRSRVKLRSSTPARTRQTESSEGGRNSGRAVRRRLGGVAAHAWLPIIRR